MGSHVKKADADSLKFIAAHMRPEDIREIEAASGRTPKECLLASLDLPGEVWVASNTEGGDPFCVFGVSPTDTRGEGCVWLLATPEIQNCRIQTFREARQVIGSWLCNYEKLFNYAHCANTLHIRWIEALGFTLGEVVKHPVTGENFQHFEMHRDSPVGRKLCVNR